MIHQKVKLFSGEVIYKELEAQALPDSQGNLMFSTIDLEPGVHVVTLTALDTDGGLESSYRECREL